MDVDTQCSAGGWCQDGVGLRTEGGRSLNTNSLSFCGGRGRVRCLSTIVAMPLENADGRTTITLTSYQFVNCNFRRDRPTNVAASFGPRFGERLSSRAVPGQFLRPVMSFGGGAHRLLAPRRSTFNSSMDEAGITKESRKDDHSSDWP